MDFSRFVIGEWYTHELHGRVRLLRAHPEVGCFFAKPLNKPARMMQAAKLMLPMTEVRPRDCYRSYEVRVKFGMRNERGELVPLSRITLLRWRKAGKLAYIQPNSRLVLYPKAAVDALLKLRGQVISKP
jgi:hypothetical protein